MCRALTVSRECARGAAQPARLLAHRRIEEAAARGDALTVVAILTAGGREGGTPGNR